MDSELFGLIENDIKERTVWANRQSVWYQMRHDGIRRKNKPWSWAADLHYALCDEKIDKLRPFFRQQWFTTERFVDFTMMDPQNSDSALQFAYWYDYKVKQCSNFETELDAMINFMLTYGHGLLKLTWDVKAKRLQYDAIDPLYLIVPIEATQLCEVDRCTHVKHLSKWKYLHGGDGYNDDPDLVRRIVGTQDRLQGEGPKRSVERRTEGITNSTDPSTIIVWETYEKESDGNFMVHTISPSLPEEPLREPFRMLYKNGEDGKPELPVIHFWMDRTERGYYSCRGVSEILSAHESSMNRMWNEKHDCMTLYNRPVLAAVKDFPNTSNIKYVPGSILPFAVQPIQMGAPPISFDQEMANTRLVAEQRIAIPDFSLGQREIGQANKGTATATQIHAQMGQQGMVVDARSRDHRLQGAKLHRQGWQLLLQYDDDMRYIKDGISMTADKKMRDQIISIRPNGSSDSWNLQLRSQKCVMRLQLYGNSPFVNQSELVKSCLELDEPGLVARLFQDPNKAQTDQARLQMMEMPALELGFPISINDSDDDMIHASICLQLMQRNVKINKQPIDPAGPTMISQHANAHMQRLRQRNPKAFDQLNNMMLHVTKQMNQGQVPDQQMSGTVAPMQPQPQEAPQ